MITTMYDIFKFVSDNFHIIGWTTLGVFTWKIRGFIDRFVQGVQLSDVRLKETQDIATDIKAGVDTIQNNHLHHLEDSMKTIATSLTSIDKGISILVDRDKN